MKAFSRLLVSAMALTMCHTAVTAQVLKLNEKGYYETRGVNVMIYSNPFSASFYDEKRSGIDIVHHGVLTVTNGGVRLTETPEQWDLVPEMSSREVNKETGEVTVRLNYKEYDFDSQINVIPSGNGFKITVSLDKPLPEELEGKACFNLEFLPSSYWNHSYIADGKPYYFPRYAGHDTQALPLEKKALQVNNLITSDVRGRDEFYAAKPLTEAKRFVMAPDEPTRLITVSSDTPIQLFDGRILAQNGWFVLHSYLPSDKSGKVLEWMVEPNSVADWIREPVIGFSQVGYTPNQHKEAVIELDPNGTMAANAVLYRVQEDGRNTVAKTIKLEKWGNYLRYDYAKADFSDITEPGIYYIQYGNQKTNIFPIDRNVYESVWYPTLDVWFPVQMDHMAVKEGYRVWHAAPHLDDVVQAPINTPHFDMFEMGSDYQSPYTAFQHIDGFDEGAWFDAGDWDVESGSHCNVLMNMATLWDEFHTDRDQTMVDNEKRYVNIHFPDGKADLLQQMAHGVKPILTMIEKIGHGCRGINHATLYQYNRLDEPSTITDNIRGTGDERWLFTYNQRGLDMQFLSALAATARCIRELDPELSKRCLDAALKLWNNNANTAPAQTIQPRIQLFLATGDRQYLEGVEEALLASFTSRNGRTSTGNLQTALKAAPYMSKDFVEKLRPVAVAYKEQIDRTAQNNPYGVNGVYGGGWGSTGTVVGQGINCYYINKYFPDVIDKNYIYRSADFIFGCHPYSNLSFVTGVGVKPKNVNYGNNRADFSFIPGALVPGLLLLQPDYIENKDDWPFFWGQNEATIGGNSSYLLFGAMLANIAE